MPRLRQPLAVIICVCTLGACHEVNDLADGAEVTGAPTADSADAATTTSDDATAEVTAQPTDAAPEDGADDVAATEARDDVATADDADEVEVEDGADEVEDGADEVEDGTDDVPPADVSPDGDEVLADVVDDAPEETLDTAPIEVSPPAPRVVLNEIECRGDPTDWVEVVNVGEVDVALDAWWVSDDPGDPAHRQPLGLAGETLAVGDRVVIDLVGFGVACGTEALHLGRDGAPELLDSAPAGNNPEGHTWGRLPDASGPFRINKPTRALPNAAPDLDPFDQIGTLYDPLRPVPTIDITLTSAARQALLSQPYEWVTATFALTDALGTTTQPAAVRIKGRIGSFRTLDGKCSFKIDFDRNWPGGRFRGVEALTLNNMVQDRAKTHEALAYGFFRAMGVPAPRVGYAWVRVNGTAYGLYSNLEAYNNPFFDNHFESTRVVFEGAYGDDLFANSASTFELDRGDPADIALLEALIAAGQAAPANGFMASTAAFLDWPEVIRTMATETLIGHWDGYAPTRNNYYLVADDAGVFRLMPWGTDQTFEQNRAFFGGNGLLMQRCVNDQACRDLYEDALVTLAAIVLRGDVIDAVRGVPAIIQPHIDVEPREGGGVDAESRFQSAVAYIERRAREVLETIGCVRDPTLDLDGDGYSCELDCDEGDPDAHVGAVDACGDGVDQDCNGRVDDGPDCPDCVVRTRNERDYRFCFTPRTHTAATTLCQGMGLGLVIIGTQNENTWVRDRARELSLTSIWLGLDDLVTEGTFVWDDGVPANDRFRDWISGEPNDYQGAEDCVQMLPDYSGDTWNDVGCDGMHAVVCEP